jgi:hypothetical protein
VQKDAVNTKNDAMLFSISPKSSEDKKSGKTDP